MEKRVTFRGRGRGYHEGGNFGLCSWLLLLEGGREVVKTDVDQLHKVNNSPENKFTTAPFFLQWR